MMAGRNLTLKKILEAAIEAAAAAGDVHWAVKGPAVFLAKLSGKLKESSAEDQAALQKASDDDLREALVEALLRLSQLLVDFPEIKELDINPLRLFHERGGCRALDARMILG